jgi:BirA family transcriptional regulator, biotin operon repressor / biotin---[acetyl-CoA-carboxylase] ligase
MNTLFIGRRIIRLKSVGSTNNFAASLPVSDAPEGTVVIANEQTEGKGQLNRSWYAEAGLNLTATVVLRPHSLSLKDGFVLNKAIALAVANTIKCILDDIDIAIKWPNDIFVNNRKMAGILTENTIRGGQFVSYLAGIGINVNQKGFPTDSGNPISMVQVLGTYTEIENVLAELCKQIEVFYLQIRQNNFIQITKKYDELLWQRSIMLDFKTSDSEIRGKISRVNGAGELVIIDENGNELCFQHGSIKIPM